MRGGTGGAEIVALEREARILPAGCGKCELQAGRASDVRAQQLRPGGKVFCITGNGALDPMVLEPDGEIAGEPRFRAFEAELRKAQRLARHELAGGSKPAGDA